MTTLQLLLDRAAIEDVVARLAHTQDDKDFAGFGALFAEQVRLQMSGQDGARVLSRDEMAELGRSVLGGFTSTQHLTSNVLCDVDGDTARCRASVQAYHHVPTDPGVADWCIQRNRWELELRRDAARSAPDAGAVTIDNVEVRIVRAGTTDYEWIARAPLVRARPGTVERFSDFPLVMYAERNTGNVVRPDGQCSDDSDKLAELRGIVRHVRRLYG